jgi:hypothetical protein
MGPARKPAQIVHYPRQATRVTDNSPSDSISTAYVSVSAGATGRVTNGLWSVLYHRIFSVLERKKSPRWNLYRKLLRRWKLRRPPAGPAQIVHHHVQAQNEPSRDSGFTLQAAFADINIRKSWSVYYWFGFEERRKHTQKTRFVDSLSDI